ncbi:MAG: cytidylyltransferase domain-containing protein [Arenicella sp.]
MKVINIIQARMGSSRFPGKMMASLHGRPVLDWVLTRCLQAKSIDSTILATSDLSIDDPLSAFAKQQDVSVYRGDEQNVLSRYAQIAEMQNADIVVRVCGDRPLIDPQLIDLAVDFYRQHDEIDLAYNHISGEGQHWPRGFGVEVLSADNIISMGRNVTDCFHCEHVTSHMWANQDKYVIEPVPFDRTDSIDADIKLDLDTKEDLLRLQSVAMNIDSEMYDVLDRYLNKE